MQRFCGIICKKEKIAYSERGKSEMARKVLTVLTDQMKRFAEFKLKGFDNKKAYIMAYPDSANTNPKTLDSKSSSLFNQKIVQDYYKSLENTVIEEVIKTTTVDKEFLLEGLKETFEKCLGRLEVEEMVTDCISGEDVVKSHYKKKIFAPKQANEIAGTIAKLMGFNEEKSGVEVQQVVIIDDISEKEVEKDPEK